MISFKQYFLLSENKPKLIDPRFTLNVDDMDDQLEWMHSQKKPGEVTLFPLTSDLPALFIMKEFSDKYISEEPEEDNTIQSRVIKGKTYWLNPSTGMWSLDKPQPKPVKNIKWLTKEFPSSKACVRLSSIIRDILFYGFDNLGEYIDTILSTEEDKTDLFINIMTQLKSAKTLDDVERIYNSNGVRISPLRYSESLNESFKDANGNVVRKGDFVEIDISQIPTGDSRLEKFHKFGTKGFVIGASVDGSGLIINVNIKQASYKGKMVLVKPSQNLFSSTFAINREWATKINSVVTENKEKYAYRITPDQLNPEYKEFFGIIAPDGQLYDVLFETNHNSAIHELEPESDFDNILTQYVKLGFFREISNSIDVRCTPEVYDKHKVLIKQIAENLNVGIHYIQLNER